MSGHVTMAIYPETEEEKKLLKVEEEFYKLAGKSELTYEEEKRADEIEEMLIRELWRPEVENIISNKVVIAEA